MSMTLIYWEIYKKKQTQSFFQRIFWWKWEILANAFSLVAYRTAEIWGKEQSPGAVPNFFSSFSNWKIFFWGERYITLTFLRVLCMKFPSEFVMEKEHPASGVEWLETISPEESWEWEEKEEEKEGRAELWSIWESHDGEARTLQEHCAYKAGVITIIL